MRKSKIPPVEELQPYVDNRKGAAEKFCVSERTIVRWMQQYDIYRPKNNYGCGKLDADKAREMRRLSKQGKTMKEIAVQFKVTISTVSRVLNNTVYKESTDVAEVSVIYNLNPSPAPSLVS